MKARNQIETNEQHAVDDWWKYLPYSGEFFGIERCPWNPFPHDSEWGEELDYRYRNRRGSKLKRKCLRLSRRLP